MRCSFAYDSFFFSDTKVEGDAGVRVAGLLDLIQAVVSVTVESFGTIGRAARLRLAIGKGDTQGFVVYMKYTNKQPKEKTFSSSEQSTPSNFLFPGAHMRGVGSK
jgi:hypothetical protein